MEKISKCDLAGDLFKAWIEGKKELSRATEQLSDLYYIECGFDNLLRGRFESG